MYSTFGGLHKIFQIVVVNVSKMQFMQVASTVGNETDIEDVLKMYIISCRHAYESKSPLYLHGVR